MFTKKLCLLAFVLFVLTGCLAGPSAQDLAATSVALTASAAPPTDTPLPLPTATQATPTPAATATPASTATASGPLVIKDDFSTKSSIWGDCDECKWKDKKLYFGPFPPNGDRAFDQVHYLICVACGDHTYYHVSADFTFASGQAGDRFYGIGGVIPDKYLAGVGITPFQLGVIEVLDLQLQKYAGTPIKQYGAIKASGATNRVEFDARPNSTGTVDYFALVNGKTIVYLPNQAADATKAALYFEWHSVGVAVDNFEFDEIVP